MQLQTPKLTVHNRPQIVVAIMLATIMQVIDTTIINVALPHIQGSLSASPDQISWTLTSYLVSSAIFMPLTGFFSDRLGRRKYLLLCIIGFTLASGFCGAAKSLTEIVTFRLLQGVFGAGLVPLAQAILTDIYSRQERGKAMAIFGIGVMAGPILGPTLGGYLTELLNWRWTFYVNVPIGILTLFLVWKVVPETAKTFRKMDWVGLSMISLAIGAFQFFLDRGNQDDWFNAYDIRLAAILAVTGFVGFLFYNWWRRLKPHASVVFDINIFKDRNFSIATFLLAAIGLGMYGTMVMQPIMLENLLNYSVLTTGLVMAPRGIASMIGMILVGKLINKINPRWLIVSGIILCVASMHFCTQYSHNIDMWWVIWPQLLQGFGLGLIFVPLSVIAYSTLSASSRVEGAGLFSLSRTLGSSIGIALTVTFFTRHSQIAWNQLGGFINPYNPAISQYLHSLHFLPNDPRTIALFAAEVGSQSQMLAIVSTFSFIMWSLLAIIPLVFIIKYKHPVSEEVIAEDIAT